MLYVYQRHTSRLNLIVLTLALREVPLFWKIEISITQLQWGSNIGSKMTESYASIVYCISAVTTGCDIPDKWQWVQCESDEHNATTEEECMQIEDCCWNATYSGDIPQCYQAEGGSLSYRYLVIQN